MNMKISKHLSYKERDTMGRLTKKILTATVVTSLLFGAPMFMHKSYAETKINKQKIITQNTQSTLVKKPLTQNIYKKSIAKKQRNNKKFKNRNNKRKFLVKYTKIKPQKKQEITAPKAIMEFGLDLLKNNLEFQLYEDEDENNIVISPISISAMLAMTANGADGKTLAEFESVMHTSIKDYNDFFRKYASSLAKDKKSKVNLANSLWLNSSKATKAKNSFVKKISKSYFADVFNKPFNDATNKLMNKWVEKNSNGMIKNMMSSINENASMYALNSVYFNSKWLKTYDSENEVTLGNFETIYGEDVELYKMDSTESILIKDDNTIGFIKPYQDKKYGFVALLPSENSDFYDYVQELDSDKINSLIKNKKIIKDGIIASIPRFNTDYTRKLKPVLQNLGLTRAFTPNNADFSKINGKESPFLTNIMNQNKIRVTEKGTEASSATGEEPDSDYDFDSVIIKLERPFVYMVYDFENNVPIFLGTFITHEHTTEN